MNISSSFFRFFFLLLSMLFWASFMIASAPEGFQLTRILIGVVCGAAFGLLLIASESIFKQFNLRSFNIASLGLFFGFMLGQAVMVVFSAILGATPFELNPEAYTFVRLLVFLSTVYLGMVMTKRASEELHLSIPFVKFKPTEQKKKDIIVDSSILLDSRIIDLASSGLLDHHLVIPRFTLKELYAQSEALEEAVRNKARRSLEVIKKLESIPDLDMRFSETDFPEIKDPIAKLIRLSRLLDANIITADINRIQQSSIEGIKVINIHALSNALKPITQNGEFLSIKIQRYGKEPRQGVGYLDDGTMVVVNGGAEYIGESIKAQVLSVKHTSSGRMIFCNTTDELDEHGHESASYASHLDNPQEGHKSYFSI